MGRTRRIPRARERRRLYSRSCLSAAHGDQPVEARGVPLDRGPQHANTHRRQSSRHCLAVMRLAVFRMEQSVKRSLIAAALPAVLCWCSPAIGQQLDYMPEVNDMSTVAIGPTSPLGIDSSSSVSGTGISLGATEIRSAGLSPLATYSNGTIALPGTGTACATSGGS